MNWVKGLALVTCLAAPLSISVATRASAETMTPEAKKAKAAECSKQATAKGLHGEARRKFRAACKKM